MESLADPYPEQFERFYSESRGRIYNLAARVVGDPDDAADITQEVFLRAFAHPPDAHGRQYPEPWLYRVAMNVCYDHLRRRSARATTPLDDAGEIAAVGDGFAESEMTHAVEAALGALNVRYRTALVLKDLHGLETGEVAEAVGVSKATTRVLLHRSRRAFRETTPAGTGVVPALGLAAFLPTLPLPASLQTLTPLAGLVPAAPAMLAPLPATGLLVKIGGALSAKGGCARLGRRDRHGWSAGCPGDGLSRWASPAGSRRSERPIGRRGGPGGRSARGVSARAAPDAGRRAEEGGRSEHESCRGQERGEGRRPGAESFGADRWGRGLGERSQRGGRSDHRRVWGRRWRAGGAGRRRPPEWDLRDRQWRRRGSLTRFRLILRERDHKQLSRAAFDRQARDYDHALCGRHARRIHDDVMHGVGRFDFSTVLDVGCGTGTTLAAILDVKPGVHALGVDLLSAMIEMAHERLGTRAALRVADAEHLPFGDGVVDLPAAAGYSAGCCGPAGVRGQLLVACC